MKIEGLYVVATALAITILLIDSMLALPHWQEQDQPPCQQPEGEAATDPAEPQEDEGEQQQPTQPPVRQFFPFLLSASQR